MREAMIWSISADDQSSILIEPEALIAMDQYWQNECSKPESGGILLGYRRGQHLHITRVSTPQPDDRRWRFLFKRSARHHQQIALQHWRESGKTMDYLGEWHTHPEATPSPSGTDFAEWRKIYQSSVEPLVFLIMGWNGQIWLGCSNQQGISYCTPLQS